MRVTGSIDMEQLLVCPFTSKPLRQLTETELEKFHKRIESGDFYFQKGIPLTFLPQKAYISQNLVYIYLELEGMLLLQKHTAIVTRNQIENPQRRVNEQSVEDFHLEMGLNKDGSLEKRNAGGSFSATNEDQEIFKQTLPKTGHCFVSMGSVDEDTVHNLLFSTSFANHLHLDHDISRLLNLVGTLKPNTRYILSDQGVLPVEVKSVDALLCFDALTELEKSTHQSAYEGLNEALKPAAVAVMLKSELKSSPIEGKYKMAKTKAALKPWKKHHQPRFYFHAIKNPQSFSYDAVSGKTSWGSQMS